MDAALNRQPVMFSEKGLDVDSVSLRVLSEFHDSSSCLNTFHPCLGQTNKRIVATVTESMRQ